MIIEMITYNRSSNRTPQIKPVDTLLTGSWIRCERPTEAELDTLIDLGLDVDILRDSLDPHEVPRIDSEGDWNYFITRLPDTDDDFNDFTTPILFAIGNQYVVTLSRDPLGRLWQPFIDKHPIPTTQKTKLFMHMIDAITRQYGTRVAQINRQMRAATSDVRNLNPKEITQLVEYERKLNDYLDALIPTNTALEKLLSGKIIELYEDDHGLIEDLSIDLEQLIARCTSLLRTITNLRDSYRAVMDTRLNETMRILTVITMAFTIPTMLAGLFGMNVQIPGAETPMMFWFVIAMSAVPSLGLIYYFMRKR
ncbi:MAG TPA: magnesium transporter CorA family protein [Candidatus Saccharimonadales bacterium]|jgi:magnesium transporter|nr:magnesium transporter CorA family protein [Candidatus Saccharimonadales bacterium]